MAPKRKKSKTNLEENAIPTFSSNDSAPSPSNAEADSTKAPEFDHTAQQDASPAKSLQTPNRASWSWRSKASPIAQIARESISVTQGSTSESSEAARPPNSVSKSVRGSRKSIPLVAEPTKVHAVSDGNKARAKPQVGDAKGEIEQELVKEEAQLPPVPLALVEDSKSTIGSLRSSWFGWWSRPDGYASDSEKREAKKLKLDAAAVEAASSTPLPGSTPTEEVTEIGTKNARDFEGIGVGAAQRQEAEAEKRDSTRSWFGLWSSTQNQRAITEEQAPDHQDHSMPDVTVSEEPSKVEEAVAASATPSQDDKERIEQPKSSGWAFWSSEKPKDLTPTSDGTHKQIGELAVADTPSQNNPEAAQFNEQHEELKPKPKPVNTRLRPKDKKPKKAKESTESSPTVPTPASHSPAPSISETPPLLDETKPARKGKATQQRPNLILPSFTDTFPIAPNPGYMDRLTQYLAQSLHIPGSQPTSSSQHIFISPSPPKVKKAVAIGVHGFFPGALIQKVLGQPTGTSIRFANHAAAAIEAWCQEHQPDVREVEIEKVALEGEGFIADRVTTLWKLLLNWLSHLKGADLILVACHSQGVPVAIMLVAKLVQLGYLSPSVRVGVCAMAGISLGPFPEYKSRLFGGSALELFEFCDSGSIVSKTYADSLRICLRNGVRVTFVGSIDDQLVSLESSLHAPLSHPYVARAVFIDGRLHAPNFLTHLVVFALKLRNLGVRDHGLLRELSAPLAGSLVGGEGHSRIYDDPAVFRLAVEFALESTDVEPLAPPPGSKQAPGKDVPAAARRNPLSDIAATLPGIAPTIAAYEPPPTSTNANPFYLPWAVRGMLAEGIVKQDPKLREEVEVLVREFEEWKPVSKVLRDVRWRLEGVRSMN